MRLTPEEVDTIKRTAAEIFGPSAVVRLFGSRVDDSKRGGDIDLCVEADADAATVRNEIRFGARLDYLFDGRKVDVVVQAKDQPRRPIVQIALETGVVL